MNKKKSSGRVIFDGILGIIAFLVFIGLLNLVSIWVNVFEYQAVVNFFNVNFLFILLIGIIMFLGDVFETFIFPFDILYPLFNAVGGALYVILAFRGIDLISYLVNANIIGILLPFYFVAILVVFLVVLIVGLVNVFARLGKMEKRGIRHKDVHYEWGDVGDEFKEAAYNLATKVKEKLEPDIKKNKRMKKIKKHGKRKREE